MPLMPPGSQTGVYYIPVGNLPWNTTWKKLKDHARNRQPDGSALAILHAYVYPGPTSTSGWVSVQGLADFRAAMDHMNRVAMEDPPRASRTLQADSRNETFPVMLGEGSLQTSSSTHPQTQHSQQQSVWQSLPQWNNSSNLQDTHSDWPYQPAQIPISTPISSSFSEIPYYQPPSPLYSHTQTFNSFDPQCEYISCAQPRVILSPMQPMSPTPLPIPQQVFAFPAGQRSQPILQLFKPHSPQMTNVPQEQQMLPPPAPVPQSHPSPKVINTEARKVIITGLPRTATSKDVQELIQSVSSTASPSNNLSHCNSPDGTRYYLQHLELARQSNGTPKGHAFAVLESHSTAKRTIDALNGHSWRGRKLHARFAKEGVESSNRSVRHGKPSETNSSRPRFVYDSAIPSNVKSKGGEPQVPRTMMEEPQRQYTEIGTNMEVDDHLCAQYANIQIDYRSKNSSPSSSLASLFKKEESVSIVRSLSSEGEKERDRKMSSENAGRHTPMVVDGSSCGKKRS